MPRLRAADVLEADGYLLGTPANIGYMSGALKHFFDQIYYPCLEATRRRPYGLYVHGGLDTGGAARAVESITAGLRWRAVRPPVCITGVPGKQDLEACWELGALLAAEAAGRTCLPRDRRRAEDLGSRRGWLQHGWPGAGSKHTFAEKPSASPECWIQTTSSRRWAYHEMPHASVHASSRCSVDYTGRLSARLPMATRLILIKADGSVLIYSDTGIKALRWMPAGNRLTSANVRESDSDGGRYESAELL